MSQKKIKPEVLYFDPAYLDLFMQAVENASKNTYISNDSIFRKDNRTVEIYDTKSNFLIMVGREYQKLISKKDGAP